MVESRRLIKISYETLKDKHQKAGFFVAQYEISHIELILPKILGLSRHIIRVLSYSENMGFKENLKSQLEYSGMFVKELAALSGVKKKTLDSYLSAHGYTPSAEIAVSIAKALGVTVEYLVTGTDNPTEDRPASSLHGDIQKLMLVAERLNSRDRHILLSLAQLLKDR